MKKNLDRKQIGMRIQLKRESLSLTQEQFAECCGLTLSTIQAIESGKRGMSINSLIEISKQLHATTDYLLKGDEKDLYYLSKTNNFISTLDSMQLALLIEFLNSITSDIIID